MEAPLHLSNLAPVCEKCDRPARVGSRLLEDKKKVRVCKSCGEILEKQPRSLGEVETMARLKERYVAEVLPQLMKMFWYGNVMQVPKIEKIVVNIGAGEAKDNPKLNANWWKDRRITGQQPVVTRAKKSIANFHLREGMPVGCKVTLRGERMYEFLY